MIYPGKLFHVPNGIRNSFSPGGNGIITISIEKE